MLAPRITKCGHLFCYACLLQYLDFERRQAWKKCPLCADAIYKRDIRKASIVFDQSTSALELQNQVSTGSDTVHELQFRLVVRNKSNTVAKQKIWLKDIDGPSNFRSEQDEESKAVNRVETSMTILESQLPTADQPEYAASRVRIGDEAYIRRLLNEDLLHLRRDKEQKASYLSED